MPRPSTGSIAQAPDRAVVERMAAGDETASRELLARYRSTVYATVYPVLLDPETVDAVVRETFRQAQLSARFFLRTQSSVSGWLTHLARLGIAGLLQQHAHGGARWDNSPLGGWP